MSLSAKQEAETLLLNAVRSHNVQVSSSDIKRALEDPTQGQSLIDWARKHLLPDNLLTVDELQTYAVLDQSGQVDTLADLQDLSEVQPVAQENLEIAIEELRRSTAAINKQTETLRHQQDALLRLSTKSDDNLARRRELEVQAQRTAQVEHTRLASEVEAISEGIDFRISVIKERTEPDKSDLETILGEILQSDDEVLASLQKLGWELDQPNPQEAQPVEKLREVCMRLIKITVQSIRARLDTGYLDALVDAYRSGNYDAASEDEIVDLQEEVESLYAEIVPVAQMSVEKQHLEPALQSVSSQSGQSLQKTAASLKYMNECLDYLLGRVNRLETSMRTYQSHQQALHTIVAAAKSEMKTSIITNPPSVSPDNKTSTSTSTFPTYRQQDAKSTRRRSSAFHEQPPLEALMQSLALPVQAYDTSYSTEERLAVLETALKERLENHHDVALNAQESFEDTVLAHVGDARRAIQLLRDSLAAETSFGEISLMDSDLDQSVQVLKYEADKAKQKLDTVDLHLHTHQGRSDKKKELLERWSR